MLVLLISESFFVSNKFFPAHLRSSSVKFSLFFAGKSFGEFSRILLFLLGIKISKPMAAKPMDCMRVAFHENDGNDENNSDNYKQGVESWVSKSHRNHGNDANH